MKIGIDTSGSMTQEEIDYAVKVAKRCKWLALKKLLIKSGIFFIVGVFVGILLVKTILFML